MRCHFTYVDVDSARAGWRVRPALSPRDGLYVAGASRALGATVTAADAMGGGAGAHTAVLTAPPSALAGGEATTKAHQQQAAPWARTQLAVLPGCERPRGLSSSWRVCARCSLRACALGS